MVIVITRPIVKAKQRNAQRPIDVELVFSLYG